MCKDGKCQQNPSKNRPVVVSLGRAARDMAVLTGRPQMVIQMEGYLAIGETPNDPPLGLPIIINVDPATTDGDIERKADQFLIDRVEARKPSIMEVISAILGAPPPVSDREQEYRKRQSIPAMADSAPTDA